MSTRTIPMTIYKIESRLIDITRISELPASSFLLTRIRVTAFGHGETHEWALTDGERVWIGDIVMVTREEPDDGPEAA